MAWRDYQLKESIMNMIYDITFQNGTKYNR